MRIVVLSLSLSLSRRSCRGLYLILPVMMVLLFSQCAKQELRGGPDGLPTIAADRKAQMKQLMSLAGMKGQEGARLRTSTTYTVSEALELLDETLNYAYCRPGTPLQETVILSDTLIMELNGSGLVTETALADLFDEASTNIGNQYHALSLSNKEPWAFSVSEFGAVENDELPIIVQLEVAYGGYITAEITYDENDNFSYHYGGGYCDNTLVDGAPEILRDNLKLAHVYNPPSTRKYFKRAYYLWVCNQVGSPISCNGYGIPNNLYREDYRILNESDINPNNWNNINDWRLFRQHEYVTVNFDKCLSGDVEMPHNETRMGQIVAGSLPGVSYHPGNIWVGSDNLYQSGYEVPFHNMVVAYYQSITVASNDEPVELPCSEC
jgi:hypothetical protein